jgi:Uma2 family endonuclease
MFGGDMSIAEPPAIPRTKARTFADLLDELGQVPPERILLSPAPGTATEADVLRLADAADKTLCELIDGTLVEKTMGFRESFLAMVVGAFLGEFVRPRNLGLVAGPDGNVRLWAGRVRIPDVAFIAWDRLPGRRVPDQPIPDLVPDLAVEVLSVSNTVREMALKREDYFRAGARLVWEIDPRARTVAVYTAPENPTILRGADVLDCGTVLPGFTLPLPDLFGELDRHG